MSARMSTFVLHLAVVRSGTLLPPRCQRVLMDAGLPAVCDVLMYLEDTAMSVSPNAFPFFLPPLCGNAAAGLCGATALLLQYIQFLAISFCLEP